MKASLRSRLARLEARVKPEALPYFRYGWLKPLPSDYAGERHVAIITREPTASPYVEWCTFQEHAGPAPPASSDNAFTLYLTPQENGS